MKIIAWVSLIAGIFPVFSAPIIDGQWDYNVWNNNVAYLEQTGWVDNNYTIVLASHTYGPLYEATSYTNEHIYLYIDPYTYTYSFTYSYAISDLSQLTEHISQQDNQLIFIICDPYIENNRWIFVFSLDNVVYTGMYTYNQFDQSMVKVE